MTNAQPQSLKIRNAKLRNILIKDYDFQPKSKKQKKFLPFLWHYFKLNHYFCQSLLIINYSLTHKFIYYNGIRN